MHDLNERLRTKGEGRAELAVSFLSITFYFQSDAALDQQFQVSCSFFFRFKGRWKKARWMVERGWFMLTMEV